MPNAWPDELDGRMNGTANEWEACMAPVVSGYSGWRITRWQSALAKQTSAAMRVPYSSSRAAGRILYSADRTLHTYRTIAASSPLSPPPFATSVRRLLASPRLLAKPRLPHLCYTTETPRAARPIRAPATTSPARSAAGRHSRQPKRAC